MRVAAATADFGRTAVYGCDTRERGRPMEFDTDLDCEGLLCPLPVLRARKRLLGLPAGQVLRVRATDRMAAVDLPHFCGQTGHVYLGSEPLGAATAHFIKVGQIEKTPG